MVINSINFWIFMAAVLLPYFLMRKKELQNVWLVLASWFFYGWVDLKMVPLRRKACRV